MALSDDIEIKDFSGDVVLNKKPQTAINTAHITPTISFDDTECIRKFEGFSLKSYPDPVTKADPWTIAWGLTGSWVKPGLVIDQETAVTRFMERITCTHEQIIHLLSVNINKNQHIAILSLTWNIGIGNFKSSTLLKKINSNNITAAADEFLKWNKAGGKIIPGLTKRRTEERKLFLTA